MSIQRLSSSQIVRLVQGAELISSVTRVAVSTIVAETLGVAETEDMENDEPQRREADPVGQGRSMARAE